MALEFGYNGDKSGTVPATPVVNGDGSGITDLGNGQVINNVNGDPADDINKISSTVNNVNNDKPADDNKPVVDPNDKPKEDGVENKPTELVEGAIIQVGDDSYTVDATGNVLAKDGSIFKEAKDVQTWLNDFDKINDEVEGTLSINAIQDAVGIEVTDENDQPIVFENTPAGVKAYVDAVNEASRDEHYEEALNTLYQKYPFINDVFNYYTANGNSLEGFGEIQDRSGITIIDTNEAQQESIIRTAWTEQNRKGDVESYIQYLKSSGTLLATSKEELAGLQEADQQYKDDLAKSAKEAEDARLEKLQTYWTGVQEVIKNKNIAGYQIPDTIIINRDGKKLSATPNDFYNYVYQIDAEGKSAYERDLSKENPNNRRDDELLRAYLKFVGGNYSNLVGMAVNKEKVATLKLQSKTRTASSVTITKPTTNNAKGGNTDFGYN